MNKFFLFDFERNFSNTTTTTTTMNEAFLCRKASFILANKNVSLTKYIEGIKKKHEEDEDYAKWDLANPLPKLPVPELSSSLEKYLRCIKPIISEASYKYTESVVAEFAKPNGIGHKLQDILLQKANQVDNWVIFCVHFSALHFS